MTKRLTTVALGIALAMLATPALARPGDDRGAAWDGYRYYSDGPGERTYTRRGRSSSAHKRGRRSVRQGRGRHAARRGKTRYAGTRARQSHAASRRSARTRVARRGVMAYARGGASRACLTGAARALLGRIEAKFGRVQVVSTCRPGATVAGSGRPSKHASGQAVDFNAPSGRKGELVQWLIANHRSGGTMTYMGMSHIHVDIGQRFVSLNARGG